MDLIILGMGNTRADCPYDSEVWGVNNGYRQVRSHNLERAKAQEELTRLQAIVPKSPEEEYSVKESVKENTRILSLPTAKLDKLFICHRGQEYDAVGDPIFDFDEINQLSQQGVEIISLFKVKEILVLTRIPYRYIVKKFQTEYFSDSIAYMIAYALHLNTRKVKGVLKLKEPMKIRMYGVDMHTKDEYATERGGIEFWIAIAKVLGVDFWIHPDSSVCKTVNLKPYGFFKLNKKLIDPDNLMELQKTEKGLKKLLRKGVIDKATYDEMSDYLKGVTATGYG